MTSWAATEAEAQFSNVLDHARSEGPQLVTREDGDYVIVTRLDWEQSPAYRSEDPPSTSIAEGTEDAEVKDARPFVSAWDALRLPEEYRTDEVLFERDKSLGKWVKF